MVNCNHIGNVQHHAEFVEDNEGNISNPIRGQETTVSGKDCRAEKPLGNQGSAQ